MEPVAIVGWAMSEQAGRMVSSRDEMIYGCVREALDSAGLTRDDIDTVITCSNDFYDGHTISQVYTIDAEGAYAKDETKVEQDGMHAMIYGVMRLLAGHHKTAMIVAYSRASDMEPHAALAAHLDPVYENQFGLLNDTAYAALQARAYMEKYKVTEEDLAKVAAKNINNGANNAKAQARKAVAGAEEVLASPMAFSPLTELMVYPETDGICVLLMSTADKAKKITKKPVWIRGVGWNQDLNYAGEKDLTKLRSAQLAAKQAYKMAKVKAEDIDFAEVTDLFAHQELMLSEAFGFAKTGKGKELLAAGATGLKGKLPINPSGGGLSAAALCSVGLVRVVEAARQLKGESENKVKSPKLGLAHGQCGLAAQNNAVAILSKDK